MGFTAKAKNDSSRTEGWGMGFFFVFFPEEEVPNSNINHIAKKKTIFSSSSSPISFNSLLRRTNSAHLLTKAQSTISICALLVFLSLLLFTLSTFEPNSLPMTNTPRRQLSLKLNKPNSIYSPKKSPVSHALQGMGTLYRRGTKAMNDLIICHVVESVTINELGLFLRLLQRSSLGSRSDFLFIFPSGSSISYESAARRENESFLKLITRFKEFNGTAGVNSAVSFDATQFVKSSKERESAEPIWGRRIRSNSSVEKGTELTRLSYGSVVGFEVDELDPENSLAGFLEHVPMNLRRWACYAMLLGRIRRNFKHVMLVDVKDVLLLGDPLGQVRNRTPESVYLSTVTSPRGKHSRKNSDKTQSSPRQKPVTPSIIMGGARGVRRLSNTMLTEIVRTAMQQQHRRKNSVSESGLLSKLAENDFILKNIKLIISTDSIPDVSSVNSVASLSLSNYTVVRSRNSNMDFHAAFMRRICSFPLDSSVYSDC